MLTSPDTGEWPGTPSSSSLWHLTMDVHCFIARRGVTSLMPRGIQNSTSGDDQPQARRTACENIVRSATRLQDELRRQEKIIAAEAAQHRIPYAAIGHALSITKNAAHNAYSETSRQPIDISCLSPKWISGNSEIRIARHLILQAAEVSSVDIPDAYPKPTEKWITLLLYLKCTRTLREALDRTMEETVAEMRALDVPWRAIGELFGCTTQAAQRRFAAGVSGERRYELHWEREAATMLATQPEQEANDDLRDLSPARAINYALARLRKAVEGVAEYGQRLMRHMGQPEADDLHDEGLKWAEEAAQHISQATIAVMAPGIMPTALRAGQLMDEILERYHGKTGTNYGAFMLYLFFLFGLSFAYCSTMFRICIDARRTGRPLTADEANECFLSTAKGTSVAKLAIETAERLYLDKIFKHFSDGRPTEEDPDPTDDD